MTAEVDGNVERPELLQVNNSFMIDALDLAVDHSITAVGPQSRPR